MDSKNEPLKLENQLCFALYVCSKEIIRCMKPYLEKIGLTYTSYIALMGLWEEDGISVNELGNKLYLDSGTLTPLLKKMEKDGLIVRKRSEKDERTVIISLTEKGRAIKISCADVRSKVSGNVAITHETVEDILPKLHALISSLTK
ncbi:MAG: MarR family transcriptional regulator [Treponema sp.]|nr:MarR family transcriptional regulator [Treponema sp.]